MKKKLIPILAISSFISAIFLRTLIKPPLYISWLLFKRKKKIEKK